MEGDVQFVASIGSDDKSKLKDLLDEISGMSERITVVEKDLKRTPSFQSIVLMKKPALPLPVFHEPRIQFTSLGYLTSVVVLLKKSIINQIKALDGSYHFETYVSLTCQKCPDVVQALNLMSVINLTLRIR